VPKHLQDYSPFFFWTGFGKKKIYSPGNILCQFHWLWRLHSHFFYFIWFNTSTSTNTKLRWIEQYATGHYLVGWFTAKPSPMPAPKASCSADNPLFDNILKVMKLDVWLHIQRNIILYNPLILFCGKWILFGAISDKEPKSFIGKQQ
jgi:hypothetical protein